MSAGPRVSRMRATATDPWLSVHAIAEHAFCPRAGLLAYENKRTDPDDEPPALDTLPRFELQAVEQEISRQLKKLYGWLWAVLIGAATSPVAVHFAQYWYLVLAGVVMVVATQQSLAVLGVLMELIQRRRVLRETHCLEPDPYLEEMQAVNWFGMLNLGFESSNLKDSLKDNEWNFEGKPWRLLVHGSLMIPVFRTRSPQESPRPPQIVKCMAYCRLVSIVYERECPYGIVLTGEDYSGFAVPNCERFRRDFHDSLVALRQLVLAAEGRTEPEVPFDARKCSRCPLGEPRYISQGLRVVRFGAPIQPHKINRDKHCDCGDRFEWTPPYRQESW